MIKAGGIVEIAIISIYGKSELGLIEFCGVIVLLDIGESMQSTDSKQNLRVGATKQMRCNQPLSYFFEIAVPRMTNQRY